MKIHSITELIREPKKVLASLEKHKVVTIISGKKPIMEIRKPKE